MKKLENLKQNDSEEELLKHEIELMSLEKLESANLDTCMTYGISGNCGNKCPKFKDKTCEVYEDVLEQENTNLKQALNEIRDYVKSDKLLKTLCEPRINNKGDTHYDLIRTNILQIIDNTLGDGINE